MPTSDADLSIVLKAGQTDRNGLQAGRGAGVCRCGEGVLADTALIGLPEIVPNYRFAAFTVTHTDFWLD